MCVYIYMTGYSTLYYIVLYYFLFCCIISYSIILHYSVLCLYTYYIVLYYTVMLNYVILYYITSCRVAVTSACISMQMYTVNIVKAPKMASAILGRHAKGSHTQDTPKSVEDYGSPHDGLLLRNVIQVTIVRKPYSSP